MSKTKEEIDINRTHLLEVADKLIEKNPTGAMYISPQIVRHLFDCESELSTLKDRLAMLVRTINQVQNEIILYQTNSSMIFDGVKKAWNINARVLCECSNEQSEYLKSIGDAG